MLTQFFLDFLANLQTSRSICGQLEKIMTPAKKSMWRSSLISLDPQDNFVLLLCYRAFVWRFLQHNPRPLSFFLMKISPWNDFVTLISLQIWVMLSSICSLKTKKTLRFLGVITILKKVDTPSKPNITKHHWDTKKLTM